MLQGDSIPQPCCHPQTFSALRSMLWGETHERNTAASHHINIPATEMLIEASMERKGRKAKGVKGIHIRTDLRIQYNATSVTQIT